jgi:uncharacterized protein HemX
MDIPLIIGIITFIGFLVGGVTYLFITVKRGASTATVESNGILRDLIKDQDSKITKLQEQVKLSATLEKIIEDQNGEIKSLRERMHGMGNEMTSMKLQVQILTDRRDYLETLVINALNKEFSEDPNMAKAVSRLVEKAKAPVNKG